MICSSVNRLFFIVRPSLGCGLYFRLEEFCRGRSTLKIIDQSSGPLKTINSALNQVLGTADKLKSFQVGSRMNFGEAIRDAARLAMALDRVATAQSKINASAARAMTGTVPAIGPNPLSALERSARIAQSATAAIAGNVARAASGAAQFAAAMQRAASTPPPRFMPPGGPGAGHSGPNGGRWYDRPYASGPLGSLQRYAGYGTVSTGHRALGSAGTGITDSQSARLSMEAGGFDEAMRRIITGEADRVADKYQTTTVGDNVRMAKDAVANLKDPSEAGAAVESMARLSASMSSLYGDPKKAADAVKLLYKAADQTGNSETVEKMNKFMEPLVQALHKAGPEVSASQLLTNFGRLTGNKYGLNRDALFDIVNLQDESKGRAGELMRTFYEDNTRLNLAAEKQAAQQAAGLRDGKGNIKDGKLAVGNAIDYALKYYKPLVEKDLAKEGKTLAGLDATEKSAAIDKTLNRYLNQRSKQLAIMAIMKEDEIKRFRQQAGSVRTDDAFVREMMRRDLKQAMTGVNSAWKNAADRLTRDVQEPIAGAFGKVADAFTFIGKNPGQAGLFGGAVVGGAVWAGHKAFEFARDNPGAAALIGAGFRLNAAASALNAAAARLALAGRPITGPGVVGAPIMGAGAKGGVAGRVGGGLWGALGLVGAGLVAHDLAQTWKGMGGNLPDLSGALGDSRVQLGAAAAAASVALSSKIRAALMAGVRGLNFVGLTTLIGGAIDQLFLGGAISKAIGDAVKKALGLKSGPTEVPTTPNDIQKLQEKLKKEGFYNGPIDGKAGPQTDAAVKASDAAVKQKEDMARAAEAEIAAKRKEREAEVDKLKGGDGKEPLAREVLRDLVNFVGGDGNKVVNGIIDWNQKMVDADRARERDAFDLEGSAFSKAPEGRGVWQRFLDILSQLNPISKAHGSEYVKRGASGDGDAAGGGVPTGQGLGDSFAQIGASMASQIAAAQVSIASTFTDAGGSLESAGAAAGTAVSEGASAGAGSLMDGIISGAQTGAAIFAEAIAGAAANIQINIAPGASPNVGTNATQAR